MLKMYYHADESESHVRVLLGPCPEYLSSGRPRLLSCNLNLISTRLVSLGDWVRDTLWWQQILKAAPSVSGIGCVFNCVCVCEHSV